MPAAISTAAKPDLSVSAASAACHATRSELAMLYTRYAWASGHASQKRVADVACGTGSGLGWLARMATSVDAGDPSEIHCRLAQETYAGREKIRVRRMDAFDLPFTDASFDLVLRLQGLDDLHHADTFLGEARRVLRPGGLLLLETASRDLSFSGIKEIFARAGFASHLQAGPRQDGILNSLERTLLPGPLKPIPRELQPGRRTGRLISLAPGMHLSHRTLYIEGRKIP
jgi:ubiquinone/menaquinone biosynthesis C-methylase UbiE